MARAHGPEAQDGQPGEERLDDQEQSSFPASDPHSDWSGPQETEPDRAPGAS